MEFQELITASQKYFPKLQVKYKDQSRLMKLMSKFMIFNPGFMTSYTTTIGNTIYYPNEKFIKCHPVSSSVILLHELVHFYDQKRVGTIPFIFSYMLPQSLIPICLALFFLVSWKIMLPVMLICLLPIPAFFRMHWEKRAYFSSFYIMQLLGNKMHFNPHLESQENIFLKYFHGSSYYYMWPFRDIDKQFDKARLSAGAGQRPFEDPVFNMLEDLVNKV
jgi:phage pi2 protein 07